MRVYFTLDFTSDIAYVTSALRQSSNKRNMSYFSKRFIAHILGYFQTIMNIQLVSLSTDEVPYTLKSSLKRIDDTHKLIQHYKLMIIQKSTMQLLLEKEFSFCKQKGYLAEFPLSPADFSMKCFHFAPFGFSCSTGYNQLDQ